MAGEVPPPKKKYETPCRRSHFAPRGSAPFRVPPSAATPKRVFVLCHYCGYTPPGDVPKTGVCPKCQGSSWQRYALAEPLVPAHMKGR